MAKPNRASLKELPSGTQLSFLASDIDSIYEDVIDSSGRFSRMGKHAGKKAVLVIMK